MAKKKSGNIFLLPCRRYLSITGFLKMSETVAILAQRHKIFEFAVRSVPINMMNKKYFRMSTISTIFTLLFESAPCISAIASRALVFQRSFFPMGQLTDSRTKFSSGLYFTNATRNYIKNFRAFYTSSFDFVRSRLKRAKTRTKILCSFGRFFRNKFFRTLLTRISYNRLSAYNAPAFSSAGQISIAMTKGNRKFYRANRTDFNNFFHEAIIT